MAKATMFDLATLKQSQMDFAAVEITNPATGEPTGIKITLAGPDSDAYRKIAMKVQNEQLQYAMKNRGKTTAERLAANALETLIGATVSWEGLAEDGKELECTPENVRRVYTEFPFIKEQVDEFLGDRRNFFKS